MNSPGAASDRLLLLDGLRGIAAFFVMFYHVEQVFNLSGPFARSYLFVDFFFLLSGFVLAISAEPKMRSGRSTAKFMQMRIARLWPVIAVGALLGAARYGVADNFSDAVQLLVAGLLMVPALWQSGMLFPLNGPQWSLMLELIANLAHALILRRLSDTAVLAVAAFSALALGFTISHFGSNTLGPFTFNWQFSLPRVGFSYTIGVWIARKWVSTRQPRTNSWPLAIMMPPILLLSLPFLPVPIAEGDILVVVVAFPPLLWFAASSVPPGYLAKWFSRFGAVSFPLYAVHLPILESVAAFNRSWPFIGLAIGLTALASYTLSRIFEIPWKIQLTRGAVRTSRGSVQRLT